MGASKAAETSKAVEAAKPSKPLTLSELEAKKKEYLASAQLEANPLQEKDLKLRFGEALVGQDLKKLVPTWAKYGTDPITKHEFRQHTRKLLGNPDSKDVDALFEAFDVDGGGSLDPDELKAAFKKLQMHAIKREQQLPAVLEKVAYYEQRAAKVQAAIDAAKDATRSGEQAKNVHATTPVDVRLGSLLRKKSMKASEIIQRWDPSGDGQIDIFEFRTNVRGLGLEASNDELDDLFRSLDEDGGGTLDMPEVKHALSTLQEAASSSDKAAKKLEKSKTNQLKTAEALMNQVPYAQK